METSANNDGLFVLAFYIGLPLVLLAVQGLIGGAIERRHLRQLANRERMLDGFLVTSLKKPPTGAAPSSRPPMLVTGEAVIASDYFKNWLFGFIAFFGGESKTFTRLFDRARREATLRMIDQARLAGYNAICNVRYESADIAGNAATSGGRKNTLKMASCTVSGTAYVQA